MKSTMFLFALLFMWSLADPTTINIFNGGCGGSGGVSSMNYGPRKYFASLNANELDFGIQYLNAILQVRPELQIYAIPVNYTDFTTDLLYPVGNCTFDLSLARTSILERRKVYLNFTEALYWTPLSGNTTLLFNIPRDTPYADCSAECNVHCGQISYQSIAARGVPINIHYPIGTFQEDQAADLKKRLMDVNATNVNLVGTSNPELENSAGAILSINANTSVEIIISFTLSRICTAIPGNASVYSAGNLELNGAKGGFPVCPKDQDLLLALNYAIREVRKNKVSCQLMEKYLGFCTDPLPLPPSQDQLDNDECVDYKFPNCSLSS